jgi:hypothetical protein
MKYIKIIIFIIAFSSFIIHSFAQTQPSGGEAQIVTVQPKIMVIPFTKEGEDIRTVLDADVNRRIAITKIKEAFDNRGFTTVDFTAKLKAAKDNNVFTSDNQTDIKSQIIDMSGADIYVVAEVNVDKGTSGTSVTLILTAYEASTGNSISNKVGESGRFYTDDIGKLASKAVESVAEEFLNTMQTKFTDIINNGKSVIVDISFDEGSLYTMSSDKLGTSGLPLSDQLEDWMSKNAFKNNYHIQGTTDLKMIFDDVHIPLKDPVTGANYNTNKFALEIYKYLKSLGLDVKKDVKGSTIYITVK